LPKGFHDQYGNRVGIFLKQQSLYVALRRSWAKKRTLSHLLLKKSATLTKSLIGFCGLDEIILKPLEPEANQDWPIWLLAVLAAVLWHVLLFIYRPGWQTSATAPRLENPSNGPKKN